MRLTRLLLLVVVVAAVAGFYASSASALAFADLPCPVDSATLIKVCPNGETGKAYSLHIDGRQGTGCYPNVKYSEIAGTMPPGLSISSDGWITGTPTTPGKYDFWLQMQDTAGTPSWCIDNEATQRQFEITVDAGLQIVQRQSVLTPAQLDTPYSLQFTANASSLTWSVASGSLPSGLSLSTSGLLSGTPTTEGDYHFQIKATDGTRTDTQTYALSVVKPLKVTSPAAVAGEIGQPFNLALTATGGRAGYTWALASGSTLPDGLTLDQAKGTVTGRPTTAGTADVKVTATDSLGLQTTVDLKIDVAAQLAIVNLPLRAGKVGASYHARLYSQGGVAPKSWTIVRGKLPTGVHLNSRTGQLTGRPTTAGRSRVTFEVTDKLGVVSKMTFVLRVAA